MDERKLSEIGLSHEDLILCSYSEREKIVSAISDEYGLFPARIKDISYFRPIYSSDWLFHVTKTFSVCPDLAAGLQNVISHIDKNGSYSGLLDLSAKIRAFLDENNLIRLHKKLPDDVKRIIVVNQQSADFLPEDLSRIFLYPYPVCQNKIILHITENDSMECETSYQHIVKLLAKGIKPGKIRVLGKSIPEIYKIKQKLNDSSIPFYDVRGKKLSGNPAIQKFMELYESSGSHVAFEKIVSLQNDNSVVLERLLRILNDYGCENLDKNPDLMFYEISKSTYTSEKKSNAIMFADLDYLSYDSDTFNILLNADMAGLMGQASDNNYLDDDELALVGMKTKAEKVEMWKQHLEQSFGRVPNLIMFMERIANGIETREPILDFCGRTIEIDTGYIVPDVSFSHSHDVQEYAKLKHSSNTYGTTEPLLNIYADEFEGKISGYNPAFSGLFPNTRKKLASKSISISPSGMEIFFGCPYQFLMGHILKLEPKTENLRTYFGSLAHMVIAEDGQMDLNNEDFPVSMGKRREMFMQIFSEKMERTISVLNTFLKQSEFELIGTEKHISFFPKDKANFQIHGKIDRLMSYEDKESIYFAIIDFKTGNSLFSEENFALGTDVQLPFYVYLEYENSNGKDLIPFGFFYQKIMPSLYLHEDGIDPFQKKMSLNGRILKDREIVEKFADCSWLTGISFNLSGEFKSGKRTVDTEYMDKLVETMKIHVSDMIQAIENGKFTIIPQMRKIPFGQSKICQFCPYRPLCHLEASGSDIAEEEGGVDDGD